MEKNTYRYIEKILYKQTEIRLAVVDARAEQLANKGYRDGGGGRSFVSNPTAIKAIKLATPLREVFVPGLGNVDRPEELLRVLEAAYMAQTEWRRGLLRRRYDKSMNIKLLSHEYDRSEKTVYNICNAFVVDVGMRLASRGFIKYG